MKILFVAIGKAHDPAIKDAILDFTGRIEHVFPIEWTLIPADTKEKESEKILKLLKADDYAILLDERGTEWSSPETAEFLNKQMNQGTKRLVFIIGGAYGVTDEVRTTAKKVWSLSRLVFPHQLVRLILAEQIYRALSIVRGEKYHHA